MSRPVRALSRRSFLRSALLTAGAASVAPVACARADTATAPTLIVAGSGSPARWAPVLSAALSDSLAGGRPVTLRPAAGWDGVTGANAFDALSNPSETGLLTTGSAIVTALAGSSRVHFDYRRWLPVFLTVSAPVVIGRSELQLAGCPSPGNRVLRVAVSAPTGPELPALLGLNLLGQRSVPVSGIASSADSLAALRSGAADVIQVSENALPPDLLRTLEQEGFRSLFTLAGPGESTFPELSGYFTARRGCRLTHPLWPAWRSLSLAAGIRTALVLPMLTPPARAALWRHAADLTAVRPDVVAMAKETGSKVLTDADVLTTWQNLTPKLTDILALRRWLSDETARWRTG